MSAPAWTDDELAGIHDHRTDGLRWRDLEALLGEPADTLKRRYSQAKRTGRLAAVLAARAGRKPIGVGASPEPVERVDRHELADGTQVAEFWNSTRITTVPEMLAAFQIDETAWEIVRARVGFSEVTARDADGNLETRINYNGRVEFRPIPGLAAALELRDGLLEDVRALAHNPPPYRDRLATAQLTTRPARHMAMYSPADHHIGMLSWGVETGADYDAAIAEDLAAEATGDVMAKAAAWQPELVTLVIGNDFFHTDRTIDGKGGTTTRGTVQETDGRWQKVFRTGVRVAYAMIGTARELAPVRVVVRPGNHDEQTGFMLGELLAARYYDDDHVTVWNDPAPRVYLPYGVNLLGFAHGHNEKPADLPLKMAAEAPDLWAATIFREWITGHLHRKGVTMSESSGVQMFEMPSLCASDSWAHAKGYGHRRASEARIYHHDDGPIAHLIFNRRPDSAPTVYTAEP